MDTLACKKEEFSTQLEKMLVERFPETNVAVHCTPHGLCITATGTDAAKLRDALAGMGIPIKEAYFSEDQLLMTYKTGIIAYTPPKYIFDGIPKILEAKLASNVKKAVNYAKNDGYIHKKMAAYEKELLAYPNKMIAKLFSYNVPASEEVYFKKLNRVAGKLRAQDAEGEPFLEALLDSTYNSYEIDVVSSEDTYKKVEEIARKSGICWEEKEIGPFSKSLYEDFERNSGTIIYSVKSRNEIVAFGRDFVCLDRQNNIHLFVDVLEGTSRLNGYYHNMNDWLKRKEQGALKAGILFNVYLAKMIGADNLTVGDEGPDAFLEALGAGRTRLAMNTDDGLMIYKLGYPPYAFADGNLANTVKSWFTRSERYRTIRMSEFSDATY